MLREEPDGSGQEVWSSSLFSEERLWGRLQRGVRQGQYSWVCWECLLKGSVTLLFVVLSELQNQWWEQRLPLLQDGSDGETSAASEASGRALLCVSPVRGFCLDRSKKNISTEPKCLQEHREAIKPQKLDEKKVRPHWTQWRSEVNGSMGEFTHRNIWRTLERCWWDRRRTLWRLETVYPADSMVVGVWWCGIAFQLHEFCTHKWYKLFKVPLWSSLNLFLKCFCVILTLIWPSELLEARFLSFSYFIFICCLYLEWPTLWALCSSVWIKHLKRSTDSLWSVWSLTVRSDLYRRPTRTCRASAASARFHSGSIFRSRFCLTSAVQTCSLCVCATAMCAFIVKITSRKMFWCLSGLKRLWFLCFSWLVPLGSSSGLWLVRPQRRVLLQDLRVQRLSGWSAWEQHDTFPGQTMVDFPQEKLVLLQGSLYEESLCSASRRVASCSSRVRVVHAVWFNTHVWLEHLGGGGLCAPAGWWRCLLSAVYRLHWLSQLQNLQQGQFSLRQSRGETPS